VSRVQVSFLASFKTPPCVGFLCFYSQSELCPVGGSANFIRTYSSLFSSNIGGNGIDFKSDELSTTVFMAKIAAGVPQIKNSHGSLSITFTPKGDSYFIDHNCISGWFNYNYMNNNATLSPVLFSQPLV
jgi:hypothetical protein